MRNILHFVGRECQSYIIRNIFISQLVYVTGMTLPVLERSHEMIQTMSNKAGVILIDNQNICEKHIRKDTLHLVESGKILRQIITFFNQIFFN